ncbi:permease [Sphaerisporangium sp. TRM90804]|uniref:permease n=1 Tax=Sphaerisporangium sp. TRM90804 TaxID=3031113 RepID=UPI00244C06E4|nr:permease [Sphaerisporangium sp. TRM90804]MDH2425711.1 permease [Sphaerisporangium sp. TRM90804]
MSDRSSLDWAAEPDSPVPPPTWGRRAPEAQVLPWVFAALVGFLVLGNVLLAPYLTAPALRTWSTIFVAICVQALPFLVFGVALSAAITAFVPASVWNRLLPAKPYAAVPVAGAAGMVLPGCECASVPVASGLMSRGVAPSAALTFLLASPAINPVVLVATAVAFPGEPLMVVARFAASLVVAVLAGWAWQAFGRREWLRVPPRHVPPGQSRHAAFVSAMRHDLLHAGGFLVVGGLAAATLSVVVPRSWLSAVAGVPWLSVLVLALLAVVLSICSEADAFVAASLTAFSPTAKLAFLVVGPMVDLKLIALQAGTFGRAFALRFVPLTFTLAVAVSALVGWALL